MVKLVCYFQQKKVIQFWIKKYSLFLSEMFFPAFFATKCQCFSSLLVENQYKIQPKLDKKKRLYDPLLWMGFNCIKAAESLSQDGLLFTTKSPGTEFLILIWLISEEWMTEWTLEPHSGFEPMVPRLRIDPCIITFKPLSANLFLWCLKNLLGTCQLIKKQLQVMQQKIFKK